MKTMTLELIRSVLKTDETISQDERTRIVRTMTTPHVEIQKSEPPRIASFGEAATRLGVSRRTIYHYCRLGILERKKILGKQRSSGVTGESLEKAIAGGV